MLFASLGLHALLLFFPMGGEEKEPRKIDEKPVTVKQLTRPVSTPKPATKPVAKPNVPQVAAAAKRPQVNRPKVATPVATPRLEVKQAPKPTIVPPPANPQPEPVASAPPEQPAAPPAAPAAPAPSPAPAAPAAPAAPTPPDDSIDAVTKAFAEPLGTIYNVVDAPGGDGSTTQEFLWKQDIPVSAVDFQDPTPFFDDPATEKGKPGVVTYIYMSPVRDDADTFVANRLLAPYQAAGLTLTRTGEFGGGPVYEVKKGTDTRYFSIVPGGSRPPGSDNFQQTGLIVVVWKASPI
jgi:hypothetical protein